MNFTVIENLLKEFENIQMSPIDDLLDILNNQVGVKVYYHSDNSISLKDYVDDTTMKKQGFESFLMYKCICIENFYPFNTIYNYKSEDNLTIVPNHIFIPAPISIASKKQFLINYFKKLKTSSRATLTNLTRQKNEIQKEIDGINNREDTFVSDFLHRNSFIENKEFINNGYSFVKLPIFPTDKVRLFAVKTDKIDGLIYAHDIKDLSTSEYVDFITEKEGYYIVPNSIASAHLLTPLDKDKVLDIFPDICGVVRRKNNLEQALLDIEKSETFIYDLKIKENFLELIDFIESNIV